MSLGTILLIVLILLLVGAFPGWGYHNYGYVPMSTIGIVLLVVIVMLLMGRV